MAPLPDYVAGTITLTNGDTAFTGSGTGWLAAGFREGDTILGIEGNEGVVYVVEAVTDNDAGTLTQPWQGATGTYSYRMRYLSDGQRVTAQARQLIEMLGNGNLQALAGLDGTPSTLPMFTGAGAMVEVPRSELISGVSFDAQVDTLVDRDAYDGQDPGFTVLVSDVGDGRSAIYSKITGGWSDPAFVTGADGDSGPYTDVTFGPVTTLAPGASASASVVQVDPGTIRVDLGIPRGYDGAGTVAGIVAGDGIDIDNSDPSMPIVSVDSEALEIADGSITFAKTASEKLYGVDSLPRTPAQRFGDVVDLDDWLVGDGNANNDAGIAALVSYMTANPGKTYRSHKARQYAFQSNFTLPSDLKLRMEGATFVRTSANATNNAAISLGAETDADEVSLRVQGSVQCFVGVGIGDQFKGSVRVVADEQQDNRGGDVRQGVRVYGGDHEIDTLAVRYFNQAVSIGEGPGNERSDIRVRNVDVAFYTRGLMCRNVTDLLLDYLNIRGRSPDALPDPGINGVLMDGCEDVAVRGGFVKDAGEHGFRLGGPTSNKRITVSDLTLSQNGQSGFKVWAGGVNPAHKDITLSNVNCIDSGYDGDGLGFNDFGFMMQDIEGLKMVNCHASRQDGTYCAYDGFYLSGLTGSQITGCSSVGAQRDGMRISQWNDDGLNPQSFNTNGIYDFMAMWSGGSGVSLQFSNGYDVRDLIMPNLLVVGAEHGVNCMASTGEFPQPCFISAMGRDLSGNLFQNTSGISNLKTLNLTA